MRALALIVSIVAILGVAHAALTAKADHVDTSEIIPVLPRDAIPAILDPTFDDDPSWHPDGWAVIGIDLGGDPRAYPLAILNWHEIANDVDAGTPVAVTFCPLCGTSIVFDRRVGTDVLTFGVSGKLYKNDLVMYDHQTESYWAQLLGEGIQGTHDGTKLGLFSSVTLPWGEWRSMHPGSKLLDRPRNEYGQFLRNYGVNPYAGYDSSTEVYFPRGNIDAAGILHPKEPVLGVVLGGEARAYPISVMRERLVVNDVLGGHPLAVTYASGVMKAWERGNRTFAATAGASMVDGAGGTYDRMTGAGSAGALAEIDAVTSFWFGWYDFYPATSVFGVAGTPQAPAGPDPAFVALGVGAAVAAAVGLAAVAWRRVRAGRARDELPPRRVGRD